jgi:hypothetical protein
MIKYLTALGYYEPHRQISASILLATQAGPMDIE